VPKLSTAVGCVEPVEHGAMSCKKSTNLVAGLNVSNDVPSFVAAVWLPSPVLYYTWWTTCGPGVCRGGVGGSSGVFLSLTARMTATFNDTVAARLPDYALRSPPPTAPVTATLILVREFDGFGLSCSHTRPRRN